MNKVWGRQAKRVQQGGRAIAESLCIHPKLDQYVVDMDQYVGNQQLSRWGPAPDLGPVGI